MFSGCCTFMLKAQTLKSNTSINPFKQIDQEYLTKGIHDTIYMLKIDSVANKQLDDGIFYSVNEMQQNLKLYAKVAWSKKEYNVYRNSCYVFLFNNVYLPSKWGPSLYYAEKLTKQNELDGTPRPFFAISIRMFLYDSVKRDEKLLEAYDAIEPEIEELVKKVQQPTDEDYYWDCMDALRIMGFTISTFYEKGQTDRTEKTYTLAMKLIESVEKTPNLSQQSKNEINYYKLGLDYYKELNKSDAGALNSLNEFGQWITHNQLQNTEFAYSLYDWKVNLLIKMKSPDSASYYVDKLASLGELSENQLTKIFNYRAQIHALKNNTTEAAEYLNKALEESFKVQRKLAQEMDALLYAQTEAEHNRLAYERSEQEKKNKNFIIIVVSICALLTISVIYTLFRLKDIKLKRVVRNLNETANIQIALMEQFESKVRKEEQQRISQNLHDDLAGTLVAIKNNIDITISETTNETEKEGLNKVSAMVESAFGYVRSKSHQLYENAQLLDEKIFIEHIQNLAEIAFPRSHYQLNIDVEAYALEKVALKFRSELMHIIKEAFTNIVKHAKATKVDVLIYKEENELIVIVKDNGIGMKEKVYKGPLGLKNINERVKNLGGTFVVKTDNFGVELIISIPIIATQKDELKP